MYDSDHLCYKMNFLQNKEKKADVCRDFVDIDSRTSPVDT